MRTQRRIKCEYCGFYCEAPRTYPYGIPVSFLVYLRWYVDALVIRLEAFQRD
jgi:hypothetical protein